MPVSTTSSGRFGSYYHPATLRNANESQKYYARRPLGDVLFYHSYYGHEVPMYQENQGHLQANSITDEEKSRHHYYHNSYFDRRMNMETTIQNVATWRHGHDIHYWNQREYIGPPTYGGGRFHESSSSVVRPSREAIDPRSYKQETEVTSYLTPPDLFHDSETARSIIRPETRNVVAPANRTSHRGRLHPDKRNIEMQSLITELCENDIVCGRGAPTRFHKGNVQFQNLILQYQSTYLFSKRPDKPRLAWALLEMIQSNGGRFVRRVKGRDPKSNKVTKENTSCFGWEQLNERQAYEKICQSLREGAPELRRRILGSSSTSEPENQYEATNSRKL